MELKNKRILITQPMLYSFSGSEVVAVELAEYLKKCGANVSIYTYILDEPIKTEVLKRKIPIFTARNNPDLDIFQFDIIWIHSQVFPKSMILQLSKASDNWGQAPYFIFLHMSSADFIPSEFPWIYRFEDTIADKVLYISEKVESTHQESLEEDIPYAYFRNPAPVEYMDTRKNEKLDRVLVVSNHMPPEVKQATDILISKGIKVDFLGQSLDNYKFIQPEIIKKYDSVITIGKTAQYCILSQTPVYIYDRFGGPGYLFEENYEVLKRWHFSGRGFEKKDAETIALEIQENWEKAFLHIRRIQETEAAEYRIDIVLDHILGDLIKRKKNNISHAQELSIIYAQRLAQDRFEASYNQFVESEHLKNRIASVENSRSMKAGRAITFLPRKCRDIYNNGPKKAAKEGYNKIRSLISPKKICLATCVYNEERNLSDYLKHIEPYVDLIVMLDDGSTDNTTAILRSSKKLRYLIERPKKNEIGEWNETTNREELLNKAKELGADWVLALDPDERLETNFLKNLRTIVDASNDDTVYGLHLRALWNSYDQFRVDGIWGTRIQYRLFPINRELTYIIDRKKLHYRWYPDSLLGHETVLDYNLYHLKTIIPDARVKRAALYNTLDPQKKYQSIGYDFMTDEHGMIIQKILPAHLYDYNSVPLYIMEQLSEENDPKRNSISNFNADSTCN